MQMSYKTWERGKDIASTTWGTDWDYYSTADHIAIIFDPKPYWIFKVSVITILHFQHLCPYESDQHFKLSWHVCCYHFFVRTNDNLFSIVDGNEGMVHVKILLDTWLWDNHFMKFLCCVFSWPVLLLLLSRILDLVCLWTWATSNVGVV